MHSLLPAWHGEELPERGFYMEAFQSELGARRAPVGSRAC